MRMLRHLSIYLMALAFALSACKKNEETPPGQFAHGVFIVNEGNYTDADGSIGFYDPEDGMVVQDAYEKANGEPVSGLFQSIYFNEDMAYIIDQLGSKIVVVKAETFEYVATIDEGLSTPRYMTVANGKGYVSNWGPFDENFDLPNSYIAVVDLSNFNVINTIITDKGVEGMTTVGDKVYAAASYSNVVHVISPQADEITGGFTTPGGPLQFAEDGTGKLWVLCNDFVTSSLARLNLSNELVETSFSIAGGAKSITTNAAGTKIYYMCTPWQTPDGVYSIDNTATFAPLVPVLSGDGLYGLGVDSDEIIYIAKSNGTDNGTVVRYTADGNEMDNFAAGRFPNGFVFRE